MVDGFEILCPENIMNKCVLDSSVIIKGFFRPNTSLPLEIYNRDILTHQKCMYLLKSLKSDLLKFYC